MDDKDLLELAAKAAGMDSRMCYCEPWNGMALYTLQDGYFGPTWNPLTDDGDALRLAVKLRMTLITLSDSVEVNSYDSRHCEQEMTCNGEDHYAATRRAIVRAAAEIGKGMK